MGMGLKEKICKTKDGRRKYQLMKKTMEKPVHLRRPFSKLREEYEYVIGPTADRYLFELEAEYRQRGHSGKGKKQKEVKDHEWVQCERCEKWRRLPLHISAKDLPENWFCSMNHWDPRSASCAFKEDDYFTGMIKG